MNKILHLFAIVFVCVGLMACATPKNVIELSSKTQQAHALTAQAHLDTLGAYKRSLTAARQEVESLVNIIVALEEAARRRAGQALANDRRARVSEVLDQYDDRAFALLGAEFDRKLEETFWPPIVARFEQIKEKESNLKAQLAASNNNATLAARYRGVSVQAEFLARKAAETESKLRREALDEAAKIRERLRARIESGISRPGSGGSADVAELRALSEDAIRDIDGVIANIERVETEMAMAYQEEKQALGQIDAYLNRPREWELVLQGIKLSFTNVIQEYSTELTGKLDGVVGKINQSFDRARSKLDIAPKVDEALAELTEKVNGKIEKAQANFVAKADAELN